MFIQYLSPMIIFVSLTMLAIRFPVSEALPMCSPDSFCFYSLDLSDHVAALFVMLPMLSLGILYWYGRPQPRRTAYLLATGLQSLRSSSAASSLWCEPSHALMTETYKPGWWKATESGWFGRRTVLAGRAKD